MSKAVKTAATRDQGEAESKEVSSAAKAFREDMKSFDETNSAFSKDMFSEYFPINLAFLFGQRTVPGTLFGQARIGVYLSKPSVSGNPWPNAKSCVSEI